MGYSEFHPHPGEFITDHLGRLEQLGELHPGAANLLNGEIARGDILLSGPLNEQLAELHSRLYGRSAVPALGDSAGVPAVPRSPLVAPDAPSLKMNGVAAAVHRLGVVRKADFDEVSAKLIGLIALRDPGAIVNAVTEKLYEDRASHRFLIVQPPAPGYERRARAALERVEHWFSPDVDLDLLSQEWSDLGNISQAEATRRIQARLKDPAVAERLCVGGECPQIDVRDEALSPQPSEVVDSLRSSGAYDL